MKKITIILCLFVSFANAQTRKDSMVTSLGDKVPVLKVFIGTVSQLRALNNPTYTTAQTTDFGGGDWYVVVGDNTTPDNGGNVIVDAAGRRWKRRYYGLDLVQWYYATSGTDSAVVARAEANSPRGLWFSDGVYNLHKFRPRSNKIYAGNKGKVFWVLTNAPAGDPTDWRTLVFFQDDNGKKIENVTFDGIIMRGNSANQLNMNSNILRFGGNFGGTGTDTTRNITFSNCEFRDNPGLATLWILSDTNRNVNIKFYDCVFDSSKGGHVQIRGTKDIVFDRTIFRTWALSDSTAYSCFGGTNGTNNHPNVRPLIQYCKFYNWHGDRFTTEISGNVIAGTFQYNEYYGNYLDVNGFSGPGWFGCSFLYNKMYDGGGGHRSGFELVGGGGNIIEGNTVFGGSLTIGTNAGSLFVGLPTQWDSLRNNGYKIKNNFFIGGGFSIGGDDSLQNVEMSGNTFSTWNNAAAGSIYPVRGLSLKDNIIISRNFYALRFYDGKWGTADSISRDLVFDNNKFLTPGLGSSYPTVLISTSPSEAAVINKYRNVVFEKNTYSQNLLYYKDSTVKTWKIIDNRRDADSAIEKFSWANGIGFFRGARYSGCIAKKGSIYVDTTLNGGFAYKTSDVDSAGWVFISPTSVISGYLAKGTGTGVDASGVYYDAVNKRLGLGAGSSPSYTFDFRTDSALTNNAEFRFTNPQKTGTRYSTLSAYDGNSLGVIMSMQTGNARLGTTGNSYLYFLQNNAIRGSINTSGYWGILNSNSSYPLTVGANAGTGGELSLQGATSGFVNFVPPASITSYRIQLPSAQGTINQLMKIVSISGNLITVGWADDNNTGGGGSNTIPIGNF